MTAILAFTEMLKEQRVDLTEVNDIQRNGEYLLHLIDDLLDLSRIESGNLELQPSFFAPDDFLGVQFAFDDDDPQRGTFSLSGGTSRSETPGMPTSKTSTGSGTPLKR